MFYLGFDPISQYLSCSSNKGTIHIFAVRNDLVQKKQPDDVLGQTESREVTSSYVASSVANTKSIFSYFGSVLPKYFDSEWSFA